MAKHEPLQWNDECEEVFQHVKEVLGSMLACKLQILKKNFMLTPMLACDQSIVLVE